MISLFVTLRSPYARKVRIVLLEKGLPHTLEVVDLQARSAAFVAASPIGKVPVLQHEGHTVPDSTVICEYLEDRWPSPPMFGEGWEGRLRSRVLEELGDSLSDQAIVAFFARARGDEVALAKAVGLTQRILDDLEARRAQTEPTQAWPAAFGVGDASVVSALGYQTLRHGDSWRTGRPALAAWFDTLAERPSVKATFPVV